MEVTYYGAGCIYINTKKLKILVDPVSGEYGPNPKMKSDVILYTQAPGQEVNAKADIEITAPGEYEIKAVTIDGIATQLHTEEDKSKKDAVSYVVSHNDLKLLVTGNISAELSEEQIEKIDGVDVLAVPVGGHGLTLDKEAAAALVRQFDPNFVVPLHYDDKVTKYPMPQAPVDEFLQEMGVSELQPQDNLKVVGREAGEDIVTVQLNVSK